MRYRPSKELAIIEESSDPVMLEVVAALYPNQAAALAAYFLVDIHDIALSRPRTRIVSP